MKKIYFSFLAIVAFIILQSASGGVAVVQSADRTGSPTGDTPCFQCHSGSTEEPSLIITLQDMDGNAVTSVTAGETYSLNLNMSNTSAMAFGFQATIFDSSNVFVGAFGEAPANMRTTELNGNTYWEQTTTLSDSSWTIEWTAPADLNGSVTVYASGVAANGNSNFQGDAVDTSSLVLDLNVPSSTQFLLNDNLSLYPTMSRDWINITSAGLSSDFQYSIFSINGALVSSGIVAHDGGQIEVEQLSAGLYMIQLASAEGRAIKKFVKY